MSSIPETVPNDGSLSETRCLRCGFGNPRSARFCSECGLRLAFFCWNCGGANRLDAHFCHTCGVGVAFRAVAGGDAIVEPPSLPAPRSTRVATPSLGNGDGGSFAVDVASSEPFSNETLGEERRVVTVLFADIVGFTTLSERLDPEEVREIVAATFGKLVELVTRYGGTVDKLMGDAIMALFGAPIAHQDDPIRAIQAALAMHQAMGETDRGGDDRQLQLRIGINTGEVVAGSREIGGYREYSVFGDAVNTAARLQTAALPGGILVGETTARLAGGSFLLEPTEPLDLRGKEQPVQAFQVRGTIQAGPGDGALRGPANLRGPLVGRIAETQRLRQRMQELARGRGQVVSVIGDHGIGKSRLVAELRGYGDELQVRWSEAHAPSYGENLSYGLFGAMVEELFQIQPGDPDEVVQARLRHGLRELDVPAAYAPLAELLGLTSEPTADGERRNLSAEQVQQRAFDGVRQILRVLAEQRPIMLVLDGLQWADPSSIELLQDVMSLCDEVPILFCYIFTPDRDAPCWSLKERAARSFPHRYTELPLGPLSEQAARALVCGLLGCGETPAHVQELVLAKTEGNPYFVEEVIRSLVEQDVIRPEGDGWVAKRDVREIPIPDTLLAVVTARIDRLPEGVRRTLQVAAVIGREFGEHVLRRVLNDGADLDRQLREAQRAGLIREETTIPERRYAFTQALIQDAAHSSLLWRRRREIHVQVGWAIEELFADDLEEQYGALARHFFEGEAWEPAFRYSRLAGELAAQAYANEEAIRSYTMALSSAEESAAGADPEVIAELTERRGDIRRLVGAYDLVVEDYVAALKHHQRAAEAAEEDQEAAKREAGHVGELALKLASVHGSRYDLVASEHALEKAFANLPPTSPRLGLAWSLKAVAHTWQNDMDSAGEAARRALRIVREAGQPEHLSAAYQWLTHPALLGVLGNEGAGLSHEWIALAREQQSPSTLFKALVAHTVIHTWGLWVFDGENLADANEAIELARTMSSPTAEATARGLLGAGLFLRGRWAEAEVELRRAARQPTTVFGLDALNDFWLARLLTLRGELDEARQLIEARLGGPENRHVQIVQNAQLAVNWQFAGDPNEARIALSDGIRALDDLSCLQCEALLHATAAELFAEWGDHQVARSHVASARDVADRSGRTTTLLAATRADALVELGSGDRAAAIRRAREGQALAQQIDQPYETAKAAHVLARALRANGDASEAEQQLERALATFESLGARPDAEAVRSAMQAAAHP